MEILALDPGRARVGIARASSHAAIAEPLKTVPAEDILNELLSEIKSRGIEAIVVGLPRDVHGHETEQTKWVRDWVEQLKVQISTTFYWQDEALTSELAQSHKKDVARYGEDAVAAALILQDFLDTPVAERVVC